MEYKNTKIKRFMIPIFIIILLILVWIYGFTVVSIEETEKLKISEEFNPAAYVEDIWETSLIPALEERALDLSELLWKMEPDEGTISKERLIPITEEYGLITVGEAHVYAVKGRGQVIDVKTKTSLGKVEISLDGYTGPIKVNLYIGPRIPSDESSVRDGVGFIEFGDFREQTEYGKVNLEINKRCLQQINPESLHDSIENSTIAFYGAFTIRTFNLTTINMKEINIVPIKIEIL
jgi:predicted lipoprotein